MPLAPSTYRLSYLQQTDYSNPTQLLEWLKLAEKTIEENEQSINQLLIEKEELIKQLTELKEQQTSDETKKLELLQLISKFERKEQENEELATTNSFLQSELVNLQNQIQQQIQQNRRRSQSNRQKDQQIQTLKEALVEKEEIINNLQQRLTELNAKEKKARLSRDRLEKHLSINYSEKAQSEIQLQKYQTQIQFLKGKNASLIQAEQELFKLHEKDNLVNQELKSDLETISGQLRTNQEQNILLEEKIRELEEELNKSNLEEIPNGTNENLSNDLQQGLIDNLEKELTEQKQVYQELEQKYQKLFLTTEKLKKEQKIPAPLPF
ncbi:15630_t:CDS:1 [Entrophospora sp. SA101]|nr:15630_t:CDS:1 [Entrophospora sp. SA101]CAJ0830736.1 17603_t:CDS:1 [Entrophospora sp. SA101]CAJ0908552.1 13451_t:CDS:1 [Entrophospora sp. SA101]